MVAEKIEFLIEWVQTHRELPVLKAFHDVVNGLCLISGIGEYNEPLTVDRGLWGNVGKLRGGNKRKDARGEREAYGFK